MTDNGTTIALGALVVTLLGNIVALVWGAAKLSSSVDGLKETTKELHGLCDRLDKGQMDHSVRIAVVESYLDVRPYGRRETDT